MDISLTRQEFKDRFDKHRPLFALAIEEDVKNMAPQLYKVFREEHDIQVQVEVYVNELLGKLILDEVKRAIDLVYQERLD